MTSDPSPEILAFAKGMSEPGGSISTFVMGDLMKKVVGHAQEMSMPVVAALAKTLADGGHRDEGSAFVVDGIAAFAPDTGDEWRSALALVVPGSEEGAGFRTVSLVERRGRPDPKFDALMESIFAEHAAMRAKDPVEEPVEVPSSEDEDDEALEDPFGRDLSEMRTDVVEKDLAAVLEEMKADEGGWRSLASVRRSWPSSKGGWSEGGRDSSFDDRWNRHFDALNRICSAAGLSDLLRDSVADYRARTWSSSSAGVEGLETYAASHDAAVHVAGLDEGLPSTEARRAVEVVQSIAMCRDLDSRVGMLVEIADMAERNGHDTLANDFDYNDLDDHVAVVGSGSGFRAVHFRDQNVSHVVRLHGDGGRIALFSHRLSTDWGAIPKDDRFPALLRGAADGTADEAEALAVFERGSDGYRPVRVFDGGIEQVKSWNGFVANVESGHCCLEEEYGSAAPSP